MNYQREKRPVDKTAEESYSWMKKKIIFMKKTRVKTWQGMIALAFITGMFSYLILSVEIGTHPISKAAGETSSLALTPSTISVAPGENFDLDIEINTDDAAVVVARAIVNYDTSNFSLISYDISSSVFASSTCSSEGKTACEIIDNDTTSGIIDITLARPSPGVNTSSGLIATLTFQALQATTDDITISFTSGSYEDSDIISDDGAGTDILSSVANTTVTVVSSACTSFTYSAWSACQPDSTQSRTVETYIPSGCSGGVTPNLERSCDYSGGGTPGGGTPGGGTPGGGTPGGGSETCTSFEYSDWSACQSNNKQYRTVTSSSPNGCSGGTPELSQSCVYNPGGGDNGGGNNQQYPDGTLLKIPESFKVYVMINQKKKWIPTPEVFETLGYEWGTITVLDKTSLKSIPDYEDNLIRVAGGYKVYLVVNGIKRHIPNPEIFLNYGFAWEDVKDVLQSVIDKYARGHLIRESRQGTIYYLSSEGVKKWIRNPEIFTSYSNNKWEDIQVISKREMDSYPESNLIKLFGTNEVYLIEGSVKHHIPNAQVFGKHQLNWNVLMDVNEVEFNSYARGTDLR